jgi:tetratricopeptide (TPR) repeat protein
MAANVQLMLNQQYLQACGLAQQAMVFESGGNLPLAFQSYKQAGGLIGVAIQSAQQWGIPIADPVFFNYAYTHFNAARIAAMLNQPQMVPGHLAQAMAALNQAINQNPSFFQYHSAAGMVLLAQGNFPEADRAFNMALRFNPNDAWSQYMLAMLHTAQGNTAAGNQYYTAARATAPSLPPLPQMRPSSPGMPGASAQTRSKAMDFLATLGTIADTVSKVAGAINSVGGLMGQFQHNAPTGWNPGGGWGW